jgi:Tol biopolymer transport system component
VWVDREGKEEPLETLVLSETSADTKGSDISVMSMEGDRARKPLIQEEFAQANPHASPDGRWLAYTSNESGQFEIYVHPFLDVNSGKWQVPRVVASSQDGRLLAESFFIAISAVMQ